MAGPNYVSNEFEDFSEGTLYPGGTGIAEEFKYVLWDYGGKMPPNSIVAVYVKFKPTDGSNDGNPVEVYWSAGPSNEFEPDKDGGRLVPLTARSQLSKSSNWGFVADKLRNGCGLESGKLSTDKGIRILEGSEFTLARVDQPTRDGLAPAQNTGARSNKPTILIPARAKFPWESGGGRARGRAASTTATAASTSNVAPAAAANGSGDTTTLSSVLAKVLEKNDNSVLFTELPNLVMNEIPGLDRTSRLALIKESKDKSAIEAIAKSNGWAFDGTELLNV